MTPLAAFWMMPLWIPLIIAPFIGSFLGVVADRLPHGETVIRGRSHCDHCGRSLKAADLVPLLSWLWLRGRCRTCGGAIGIDKPLIELAATAVALWALWALPAARVWPGCILGWTLLPLAVIDMRHLLLHDVLTLPLLLAGLAVEAWHWQTWPVDGAVGAILAGLLLGGVALTYQRIRRRPGLGWGDVKLLSAGGAWVGWLGLPTILLVAATTGLAWVLVRSLLCRTTVQQPIPFGPALALGIWLVWLYGPLRF
ncbi:MAG: A24 family peptidase [Azospirillaceae bacterium]|nr:A24 family peptidase [Azospirillaceae bacterium]